MFWTFAEFNCSLRQSAEVVAASIHIQSLGPEAHMCAWAHRRKWLTGMCQHIIYIYNIHVKDLIDYDWRKIVDNVFQTRFDSHDGASALCTCHCACYRTGFSLLNRKRWCLGNCKGCCTCCARYFCSTCQSHMWSHREPCDGSVPGLPQIEGNALQPFPSLSKPQWSNGRSRW